jgi:hypothetical protein
MKKRYVKETFILQYNVRKSKDTVMATLLRDPKVHEYDILAIQEPWKTPHQETTHYPAKNIFHLCYSKEKQGEPARVCLFVHKTLDHTKWQFIDRTRDLCTLVINIWNDEQHRRQLAMHNIYNPCKTR